MRVLWMFRLSLKRHRSILVDYIESRWLASKGAVAYIYFDYKSKEPQTVLAVFCSILRQIIESTSIPPTELEQHYDSLTPERIEKGLNIDDCFSFLQQLCKRIERVFLTFDALDECPILDDNNNEHRSKMINMIKRATQFAKVFVTSRPNINLKQDIVDCTCIEVQARESDIRTYLKTRVASQHIFQRIVRQVPSMENHLIENICSKSNGM